MEKMRNPKRWVPRWSSPLLLRLCPTSRGRDKRGLNFILSWNNVKLTVSPSIYSLLHELPRPLPIAPPTHRTLHDCYSSQLDFHYTPLYLPTASFSGCYATPN